MKRACSVSLLVALLLAAIAPAASSAPESWVRPKPRDEVDGAWHKWYYYLFHAPELRDPGGLAFDPVRSQLVSFTSDWVGLRPVDSLRAGRSVRIPEWPGMPFAYVAVYDPPRDRIVVLTPSREDPLPGLHFDTYALQLGDSLRWSLLVPLGESPNLAYTSAIYDPDGDRMIVYGGMDGSEGTKMEGLGEVWAFSLGDQSGWTRLEPRGPAPPPRMMHTAIYDPRHRAMVIYGGWTSYSGAALGDVWSLDLGPRPRWREIKPLSEAPASRGFHAAIYDAPRDRMIVVGGAALDSSIRPVNDGVWALPLRGLPQWSRLEPSGEAPPPCWPLSAFADPTHDRVILEGDYLLWTLEWGGLLKASPSGFALPEPRVAADLETREDHQLSLSVPSPIWRGGALMVRVSLPEVTGARLGLFDAGGRRIWAAGSDALGPGTQDVAITPSMRVPAGVYFLRLEQSGQSASKKILRLR